MVESISEVQTGGCRLQSCTSGQVWKECSVSAPFVEEKTLPCQSLTLLMMARDTKACPIRQGSPTFITCSIVEWVQHTSKNLIGVVQGVGYPTISDRILWNLFYDGSEEGEGRNSIECACISSLSTWGFFSPRKRNRVFIRHQARKSTIVVFHFLI